MPAAVTGAPLLAVAACQLLVSLFRRQEISERSTAAAGDHLVSGVDEVTQHADSAHVTQCCLVLLTAS